MKKITKILLLISAAVLLKSEIVSVEKIVRTLDNKAFQILQTNSKENIINLNSGGAISIYNLNNLFNNNDLFGDLIFGTLIPKYNFPWRSHYKPIGSSHSFRSKGGEIEMVSFPKMSNSELKKSRMEYYAAKRRVDSLENTVANYIKIIETGKKQRVKVDKVTRDKTIEIVKLTDVQIKDTKRKLAAQQFLLMVAKDELKEKDFGFSQATGAISDKILNSKQSYKKKKAEEKVENIKALLNSAVMNGSLQSVVDLQNLVANGGDIKQIKSGLMKIVRKENKNGYPIKNLSFKTVEIIMSGLLKWNSDKDEQPFPIS